MVVKFSSNATLSNTLGSVWPDVRPFETLLLEQSIDVFIHRPLLGTVEITRIAFTLVATVKCLCAAIAIPRSHIKERRSVRGRQRTWLTRVFTTLAVFLPATFTSRVNRD
ncbi:MAG: hypothetical protein R3B95_10010 [Nitrospirales bacterium]|nr:hypothetical protein [Nitrospirales bacterium]